MQHQWTDTYKRMLNQASLGVREIELLELAVKESDEQSEESRSLLLEAKEDLRGIMNSIVSRVAAQEP